MVSYSARVSAALAGICWTTCLTRNHLPSLNRLVVAFALVLSALPWDGQGADTNLPPATSPIEETDSQALLRGYLQLQEQLQATQLAIEQNRREAEKAALQTAEAISIALVTFQDNIAAQQARHLAAMQRSNRLALIVAVTFATVGFLVMLMMSYFQWRMSQAVAGVLAALPASLRLGPGPALGSAEESSLRLLAAAAPAGKPGQETERTSAGAPKSAEAPKVSIEHRLFPTPGVSLRRRPVKALRIAIIVGLVCAGVLALLIYLIPGDIEYILERLVQ